HGADGYTSVFYRGPLVQSFQSCSEINDVLLPRMKDAPRTEKQQAGGAQRDADRKEQANRSGVCFLAHKRLTLQPGSKLRHESEKPAVLGRRNASTIPSDFPAPAWSLCRHRERCSRRRSGKCWPIHGSPPPRLRRGCPAAPESIHPGFAT